MINRYTTIMHSMLVFLAIFASLSIALPTAFISIAMGLFVIFWVVSGNYADKYARIRHHPAALVAIALFVVYGLCTLYSSAPWEMRLTWWFKYHKLLYIPMIICILTEAKMRRIALHAFLGCMLFILLISYLKWMAIVPHEDSGQGFFVFRNRIAHNIFMAFAMHLMLYQATIQTSTLKRWLWISLSVLAAINIFFLVNGRTGQVLMVVLFCWFCWEIWGAKSIKWLVAFFLATAIISTYAPSASDFRITQIKQEMLDHNQAAPTSSGQRIEFYTNALTLIKQHPIIGSGTGSFENEYKIIADQQNINNYVPNPHNEFLLTWQQLGIGGLILLLAFFAIHWKTSYKITSAEPKDQYFNYALRGLIITIFVGSLFNSLLLDSGEGKFYCVLAGIILSAYQPKKSLK